MRSREASYLSPPLTQALGTTFRNIDHFRRNFLVGKKVKLAIRSFWRLLIMKQNDFLFCKIKFRHYWGHYCTVSFNIRTLNEKENNLFKARASESKGFTSLGAFLWALVPFFTSLSLGHDLLLGHGCEKWMRDEDGRGQVQPRMEPSSYQVVATL